jgi:hypothetical protein
MSFDDQHGEGTEMTLDKDKPTPPPTRTQKVVKWVTYVTAGVFLIAAIIVAIVTHAKLF